MRLIVGISGASGVVLGYEMLKALKLIPDCEVHLVVTEGAVKNLSVKRSLPYRRSALWPMLFTVIKIWLPAFPAARLKLTG